MFGIDFSELMVILVIALVVLGPERLPKVARTLGMVWGRAQRYINGVKADIARDMAIEELRQMQQKVQREASSLEQSVQQVAQNVDQQVREIGSTVARPLPKADAKAEVAPSATQIHQKQDSPQAQLVPEQKKFPVD